jgi:isocitrate dehydrogenase
MFYKEAFEKHGKLFDELGVNVNNGMANLYDKIASAAAVAAGRDQARPACLPGEPPGAGDGRFGQGHHQLPFAQRRDRRRLDAGHDPPGGKMYGADGRLKEVKAVIPESTFARIYQEIINFCKWHGNFDPKTMGTVPNVGLMAQQAEEYGSHDKTFEVPEDGVANITDLATGEVLLTQNVEQGDIWRMCQVKDAAIRDWVKLAVTRARNSGMPRCSGWTTTARTKPSCARRSPST